LTLRCHRLTGTTQRRALPQTLRSRRPTGKALRRTLRCHRFAGTAERRSLRLALGSSRFRRSARGRTTAQRAARPTQECTVALRGSLQALWPSRRARRHALILRRGVARRFAPARRRAGAAGQSACPVWCLWGVGRRLCASRSGQAAG
jgi:hypothetical protein